LCIVPSSPPTQFVASARSSSEIIVQWSTPLEEHRNGQILGYILRYKLSGYKDTPWTYANATEVQRNFLIQDLITWKEYIIQIAAFNNMGIGVYADEVKVKTKEGIPEAPPRDVKVKVLNSTSVLISWNAPNPQQINGINQGYKIQATRITENNEKEIKTLKVPPNLINPFGKQNCTLTNLKKFSQYNITILCFTNPGDGIPSQPIQIRTYEDVPEEVSYMQFTGVSDRELTLKWSEPNDKNGILTGYQVKYKVKDSNDVKVANLTAQQTELHVTQLKALTHYWFEIAAMTSKGIGKPKVAVIQSGIEPVLPEPPKNLALSNIEAFSVVIQFTPQFDGNSSIIKWVVDAQTSRNDMWNTIYEISDPDANSITVNGLHPYTAYKLRITSVNVVGKSEPSEPTKDFQTLQAVPKHAPYNVTVRAMSSTELRVRWIPLQQSEWFGVPRGYNISFRISNEQNDTEYQHKLIVDPTANSHILKNLNEWSSYEIVVTAVNEVGQSTESPIAIERTRESVPSLGPITVSANATSSTTIVVKWTEIPQDNRNGQIEGYKIFYGGSGIPVLHKIIKSNKTFTTTLTELRKFAVYHIQVAGYTRLGDGKLSVPPIQTQTYEDTPSYPSNVSFPDVSYSTGNNHIKYHLSNDSLIEI
jgi:protein sidekick